VTRNATGRGLEDGQLILFHGRLAEVLEAGGTYDAAIVEVIDAGGLAWTYKLARYYAWKPLQYAGECILDAIRRAAAQDLPPHEQLRRMAELWLADPQVGDVFLVEDGYLLELTETLEAGAILATKHPYKADYPLNIAGQTSFQDGRRLRRWLKLPHSPVYRAAAFATKRKAFEAHELLNSMPPHSPLFPVKSKSSKEVLEGDINGQL